MYKIHKISNEGIWEVNIDSINGRINVHREKWLNLLNIIDNNQLP
jgi:hypothetical protein